MPPPFWSSGGIDLKPVGQHEEFFALGWHTSGPNAHLWKTQLALPTLPIDSARIHNAEVARDAPRTTSPGMASPQCRTTKATPYQFSSAGMKPSTGL